MRVSEIISLIPDSYLSELALSCESNKYSKKLSAEVIFKLLIHCIISYKDNSLRRMSSSFEGAIFTLYSGKHNSISHSSISEKLSSMNSDFFEKLYQKCVDIYGNQLEGDNLLIADSTIVSLSSKLLHTGFNLKGGDASKLQLVKYTMGLCELPIIADVYTDLSYTSENKALGESLDKYNKNKELIRVFDRGIFSRAVYEKIVESGTTFVSRINTNTVYRKIKENRIIGNNESNSVHIYSDETVDFPFLVRLKSLFLLKRESHFEVATLPSTF